MEPMCGLYEVSAGEAGGEAHAVCNIFDLAARPMLLQNHPHQIQAQAAAAAFAVAGLLLPVERIKQVRQGRVANLYAGVLDGEHGLSTLKTGLHLDQGARRRVECGVGEYIFHGLGEHRRVCTECEQRRQARLHTHLPLGKELPAPPCGL